MKTILNCTLILLLCLFFSCKKEFQVSIEIHNDSARKLSVLLQKEGTTVVDSNSINSNKRLTILTIMGEDQTPEDYIATLSSIPLDFLEIKDMDNNPILCEELPLDCWNDTAAERDETTRMLILEINEESF